MSIWLFGIGALGALGGLIGSKLPSFEPERYAVLLDVIQRRRRDLLDRVGLERQARVSLLQELFRMTGDMGVIGPTGHPVYHKPGPHDEFALATAATLFLSPEPAADAFEVPLPTTSLFTSGSPVSSRLAATLVPVVGSPPKHGFSSIVNPSLVPYHFLMSDQEVLWVKSATQEGATRPARNHGLITEGRLPWRPFRHTGKGGWLETDFLLLTVMPRNLDGARLTVASGGHGPGTGATSLLLNPDAFRLSKLESLVGGLKGADGFQVVFEISVNHAGSYSAPYEIRVSEECPPRKIECTSELFSVPPTEINERFLSAIHAEQAVPHSRPPHG